MIDLPPPRPAIVYRAEQERPAVVVCEWVWWWHPRPCQPWCCPAHVPLWSSPPRLPAGLPDPK